jgi:hypothetical protein
MDPYLENPELWPGYHNAFVTYACEYLQPALPDNYVATIEVRIYREREAPEERQTHRQPDLTLARTGASHVLPEERGQGERPQGFWVPASLVERREAYLTIVRLNAGEREPVTTVELLSPTNKRPGTGRDQYLAKQADVLQSRLNFVEIDLLRGGSHTVSVPAEDVAERAPYDYLACITREAKPWGYEVFAWRVPSRMPRIPIPLADGDPEQELDLQQVHERTYTIGAFHKLLHYEREPVSTFGVEDAAWADELLRKAGLRRGENGA